MTDKYTRPSDTIHAKLAQVAHAYVQAAAKHKSQEMYLLGVKIRLAMREASSMPAHEGWYELTDKFKAAFYDVGDAIAEYEEASHD